MGQQGQAYLLFVTWKNFRPLLEYWSGDAVKLPRYSPLTAESCVSQIVEVFTFTGSYTEPLLAKEMLQADR